MPLLLVVILVIALMGISLLVFQLTVPVESLHNPYTGTPSW